MSLTLKAAAGQVIVGGFSGAVLTSSFRKALERGERGGAVLFRRNILGTLADVGELNRSIANAAPSDLPPLLGVDQEGGRVTRLGAPVLRLPTMRALGSLPDTTLVERAARALGAELLALGFNMSFAPVLDVDTCTANPIIGDRSFGSDPVNVAAFGAAYARGLQATGVMACGKHFPGHGDTTTDSHLELPRVMLDRSRLETVELVPFCGLRAATCAALMTAHVVYDALDAERPATLSHAIATTLLRRDLGFDGLLISDDLEMKAIADHLPVEESAVVALRAGCDVLLICSSEDLQERAHGALVREGERDLAFRDRLHAAAERGLSARRRWPSAPASAGALDSVVGGAASQEVSAELRRLGLLQ